MADVFDIDYANDLYVGKSFGSSGKIVAVGENKVTIDVKDGAIYCKQEDFAKFPFEKFEFLGRVTVDVNTTSNAEINTSNNFLGITIVSPCVDLNIDTSLENLNVSCETLYVNHEISKNRCYALKYSISIIFSFISSIMQIRGHHKNEYSYEPYKHFALRG